MVVQWLTMLLSCKEEPWFDSLSHQFGVFRLVISVFASFFLRLAISMDQYCRNKIIHSIHKY